MKKYKISAVSYLNTSPFINEINRSSINNQIDMSLDYPSICGEKLIENIVDIALVPTVLLRSNSRIRVISDYCIGAVGKVDSVCLYSKVPLNEIDDIYLDYQSKTSVELLKILCRDYWNINPNFISDNNDFDKNIKDMNSALVIGDRAFLLNKEYDFVYDLSEYWYRYTGLPFVFACWAANKDIDRRFLELFNKVLSLSVKNIELHTKNHKHHICPDVKDYLTNKISYHLDVSKKKGMSLFLDKITL